MWFSLTLRVGKTTYGLNGQRRQKACHIALPNFPRIYPQARDITEVASCSTTKSTWCNDCVRGMRTQPLICVGCSVHYWVSCAINKGGIFSSSTRICLAFRRHTFASLWGDTHLPRFEALTYVLPQFDALIHVVILVSSAFSFQRFAEVWYSVFEKRSSFKKFAESS